MFNLILGSSASAALLRGLKLKHSSSRKEKEERPSAVLIAGNEDALAKHSCRTNALGQLLTA